MNINKKEFLSILNTLSIEEINEVIKQKGKQPKLITPAIFIKSNK